MQTEWQDREFVDWYNRELEFDKTQIQSYLDILNPGSGDTLVDFGCGNGVLLEMAAPHIKSALGVDSSGEQIALAKERLKAFPHISLKKAGFLDCSLESFSFTRGSARKALHHLTDSEKHVFFRHISSFFQPGSMFIIEDAVFDFHKEDLNKNTDMIFREAEGFYGDRWKKIKEAFEETIFEEYPADIWTWEKALEYGGFRIIRKWQKTCFLATLLARRG